MAFYTDQLARTIELKEIPKRIISLVPSQTELLRDLGLEEEVIGITKFCVHPQHWFQTKVKVGGTKQLHTNIIKELLPDLIIANKEENVREQIDELASQFPVWVSDVQDLESALRMITSVGELVDRSDNAVSMATSISHQFRTLQGDSKKHLRTAYLVWKDPYMVAGKDTFISDMMRHCGFNNVLSKTRYPEVSKEGLQDLDCELLLLSSEPYPFREKHVKELEDLLPGRIIILVNGEMFSWYGSRLLEAAAYFKQLQNQVLSLRHARGTK
jgi:ABC-type Fe3+-hydroxamate transport system substrate-binding protein